MDGDISHDDDDIIEDREDGYIFDTLLGNKETAPYFTTWKGRSRKVSTPHGRARHYKVNITSPRNQRGV